MDEVLVVRSAADEPIELARGALYVVSGDEGGWLTALGGAPMADGALPGLVDGAQRAPGALSAERAVGYAADLLLDALELDARRERLRETLAAAGLAELLRVKVAALGGDDRLRVALAIELLRRPALLIVTPPASDALLETLAEAAALGVTIVCVAGEGAALPAGARRL
jgi:ABC-type uncharacterized transport system YnjBCD ATPase subunit